MVSYTKDRSWLSEVTAASLTDALGRRHNHRCHLLDFVSPTPERKLFGKAATVRFVPVRKDFFDAERHNFARLFYESISSGGEEEAGTDKVLVISASGHRDVSVGGGTKLGRVQHRGLAGVLAEARLRDFHELKEFQFSTWCRGETTRWGGDVLMPLEANTVVTIDAVTVVPGDYIYADRSGAVIIPQADLDFAVSEALSIEADDRRFAKEIENENPEDILKKGSQET